MDNFQTLEPILTTFRSHVCLVGKVNSQDGLAQFEALQTWLRSQKMALVEDEPQSDDLSYLFGYELKKFIFDFLFDFLQRNITVPQSPTSTHEPFSFHTEESFSVHQDEKNASHPMDPVYGHSQGSEDDEGAQAGTEKDGAIESEARDDDLLSRHLTSFSSLEHQPM